MVKKLKAEFCEPLTHKEQRLIERRLKGKQEPELMKVGESLAHIIAVVNIGEGKKIKPIDLIILSDIAESTFMDVSQKNEIAIDMQILQGFQLKNLACITKRLIDKILEKEYLFDHLGNEVSVRLQSGKMVAFSQHFRCK